MPALPRIVVVGSANTDLVARVPALPAPGQTVLATSFAMVAGGKGANQAVAASRLGASVVLIGRVGDDLLGDRAVASLALDGIDTSFIVRDPDIPSGVALIGVDDAGENSIVVAPGANAHLTAGDVHSAADAITAASVLICQLEVPLEAVDAALTIAWSAGVLTILNPAPARALPGDLLKRVSILTPNQAEACLMAGEKSPADAARKLVAAGVAMVIVTRGSEGALIVDGEGEWPVPAPRAKDVVDTTAAGDCLNGALAVALAEGKPLRSAVQFACAAASVSVTRAGAQPSLPYRNEVR